LLKRFFLVACAFCFCQYTCLCKQVRCWLHITFCMFCITIVSQRCLGGPRFADNDENHKVTVNQDAELLCSPNFHPDVSFRWFFEYDIGNGSREVWCTNQSESERVTERIRLSCTMNRSTLIIRDTEFDDAGVYWCEAAHMFNRRNKTFHLSIKSEPLNFKKSMLYIF